MGCGCGERRSPMAVTSANINLPPHEAAMEAARNAIENAKGRAYGLTDGNSAASKDVK